MTRFGIDYEMTSIDEALDEQQGEWGVSLVWHRWDPATVSDDTYDVVQSHTTQTGWTPPATPSLFTPVP